MRVNAADIEAAITPRTRAVIINSPGNPTGAVTSAAELARIAEVCKQHNIWAISDEVYHPFVFGETFGETLGGEAAVAPSIAAVPGMKERTIVVESLSKTYAMTGWAHRLPAGTRSGHRTDRQNRRTHALLGELLGAIRRCGSTGWPAR